ncbi:MAG TPA: hypothetical protein VG860_10960 [Terriglobia bacterium]|jgi:hypothetical protein|nr:hypothetical protein [Terriglobia bacterium]
MKTFFRNLSIPALVAAMALILTGSALASGSNDQPFLPNPVVVASTVPSNGDVNPYGVAFVPQGFPTGGTISAQNLLISNFNNNQNLQGTGSTIIKVANSTPSLFFQGPSGIGLSTALEVLQEGYVLAGNFPSVDGTCGTASPGNFLVINKNGSQIGTLTNTNIDGPWDSYLYDQGSTAKLFVANGLSGTVVRLDLAVNGEGVRITSSTVIASGYQHQCDPVTFVDAPTGLVYVSSTDTLYVASSLDNEVFAVSGAGSTTSDAGTGVVIYEDATHLHGALAMAQAPNGDLLVSNNDVINGNPQQPSEIVEFTLTGTFVKNLSVDPNQGGSFGLNVQVRGANTKFAAVDDNASTVSIWTLNTN